ncbi:MAG: MoxR family ATPase [Defluviitaleaceae bacterium]|nr:MoxR family ATPase [Defluviitaleaceae bacterium]MCL2276183.1 MoxR family ATPase [Defluviitaleaceae bacterium]
MDITRIIAEVEKVIVGKRHVIEKILTAILANGHILLDDVPGIGKTTLALALSRSLGLTFGRIQCTPDVLPSDIVGFSMYNKAADSFTYKAGIVTGVHLLLADEINRTSSKTQSALLEAMEEKQVTVDGESHSLRNPFIVFATQNNVGTAGTQLLPYAQLDRFLVKLSIGYPNRESEMEVIRGRQRENPIDNITQICTVEDVVRMQNDVQSITVHDRIIDYIARLAQHSRNHALLELGISPRGSLFVNKMAKAWAYMQNRGYVIPEDVQAIYKDTCAHRLLPGAKARMEKLSNAQILQTLLSEVAVPDGLT